MPNYKCYNSSNGTCAFVETCEDTCKNNCSCSNKCSTPSSSSSSCNVNSGLVVEKNLLSVCRIPLANIIEILTSFPSFIGFSQLLATYEIVLHNNTSHTISNLSIMDTLAGEAFSRESEPFESTISVVSCSENLSFLEPGDIGESGGQLLNVEESSIPPCTTCKIILKLALSAPEDSICEIRHVMNTICVDGDINGKKIRTITQKSDIFKTESDIGFLVGINFNINFDIDL